MVWGATGPTGQIHINNMQTKTVFWPPPLPCFPPDDMNKNTEIFPQATDNDGRHRRCRYRPAAWVARSCAVLLIPRCGATMQYNKLIKVPRAKPPTPPAQPPVLPPPRAAPVKGEEEEEEGAGWNGLSKVHSLLDESARSPVSLARAPQSTKFNQKEKSHPPSINIPLSCSKSNPVHPSHQPPPSST